MNLLLEWYNLLSEKRNGIIIQKWNGMITKYPIENGIFTFNASGHWLISISAYHTIHSFSKYDICMCLDEEVLKILSVRPINSHVEHWATASPS